MAKVISIGNQSFESMRERDNFYVDKTSFIKEWWENEDIVTLITRPRRFGKTLNMNMLECFFSNQYKDRGDLFEGLDIWKEEKYRKLQGTYPVIFLSFAGIKGNTFEMSKKQIGDKIVELYESNRFLLKSECISDTEKKRYISFLERPMDEDVSYKLNEMSNYLSRYYGKKVIILLDEYDTPMQEAYVSGYWKELVAFTRSLFNATFKANPYLERAIMTGITRVSKESIFFDLNNLVVVTTTSNQYETAFGFTEEEVFNALDEQGLSEKKQDDNKGLWIKMKRVDFENGTVTGNILEAALPMLVAQILNLLYNIVDRIYIARIAEVGTAALGAVGLCFPLIVIITAFANLFGNGGAPLFAIQRGQKDERKAVAIMDTSFTMVCASAIVLLEPWI